MEVTCRVFVAQVACLDRQATDWAHKWQCQSLLITRGDRVGQRCRVDPVVKYMESRFGGWEGRTGPGPMSVSS